MSRVHVEAARCEALFVSSLQGSQRPDSQQVREAVTHAIRSLGVRGCCAQVAQEFGDHPEMAAERMRWARQAVSQAYPALGETGSGIPRPLDPQEAAGATDAPQSAVPAEAPPAPASAPDTLPTETLPTDTAGCTPAAA
jgi:hypothetical protein